MACQAITTSIQEKCNVHLKPSLSLSDFDPQMLQLLKVVGITFSDMFDTGERQTTPAAQSNNGKGHEEAMIAMPVNQHASLYSFGPTLNNNGILPGGHGTARATQFGAQVVDAVGLFVVQALDIVEDAFPFSKTGCGNQDGDTVNNSISIHFNAS